MQSQTNFEEILSRDGELHFTNVGYSMYPLIKQREDILYIKATTSYKKGDIILYKSDLDHYVLHRIISIKKDKIICAGDYNPFKDKPITSKDVLGILISISKKNGQIINLDKDKKLRKFFYTNFFYIKAFFQRVGNLLHIRRIK